MNNFPNYYVRTNLSAPLDSGVCPDSEDVIIDFGEQLRLCGDKCPEDTISYREYCVKPAYFREGFRGGRGGGLGRGGLGRGGGRGGISLPPSLPPSPPPPYINPGPRGRGWGGGWRGRGWGWGWGWKKPIIYSPNYYYGSDYPIYGYQDYPIIQNVVVPECNNKKYGYCVDDCSSGYQLDAIADKIVCAKSDYCPTNTNPLNSGWCSGQILLDKGEKECPNGFKKTTIDIGSGRKLIACNSSIGGNIKRRVNETYSPKK